MIKVLIVSGSPHRDGLCIKLSREIAKGIHESGAEAELISLADKNIGFCLACREAKCWAEMKCAQEDDCIDLRKKLNEAQAFAFLAPVYFLSINGLAKNFMDRMRYYGQSGRPALAVSVAGGTGKGCILALQDMCYWLLMLGFRPIAVLPVTRYNFDLSLSEARIMGRRLAQAEPKQFGNLTDKIFWYENLPYMIYNIIDEIAFLARIAIEGIARHGKPELVAEPKEKLEKGLTLLNLGKYEDGLKLIVESHEDSMRIFNSLTR